MIGVIIASRKVGINPDNVATPIAASLGDLITLSLLAGVSTGLYKELGNKRTHRIHVIDLVSNVIGLFGLRRSFSCFYVSLLSVGMKCVHEMGCTNMILLI